VGDGFGDEFATSAGVEGDHREADVLGNGVAADAEFMGDLLFDPARAQQLDDGDAPFR
jgi:hypothetical protein